FFSLITLWPPPIFTLFPYTTLFRSDLCTLRRRGVWHRPRGDRARAGAGKGRARAPAGREPAVPVRGAVVPRDGQRRRGDHQRRGDRKSTRLNSSHSQISYAVFCLKK